MAITIEGTSNFNGTGDISHSYALPAGTTYIVVVIAQSGGTKATPFMQWNGTTLDSEVAGGTPEVSIYTLATPDVGTYNLVLDYTNSPDTYGTLFALSGVSISSDPVDGTNTASGTGTAVSCSVTATGQGSLGIMGTGVNANEANQTVSADGSATEIYEAGNATFEIMTQHESYTGTGSKTTASTISTSRDYAGAMILIREGIEELSVSSTASMTDSQSSFRVLETIVSSTMSMADSVTSFIVKIVSVVSTVTLSDVLGTITDTFKDITNQTKESDSTMTNTAQESDSTVTNVSKSSSTMTNDSK